MRGSQLKKKKIDVFTRGFKNWCETIALQRRVTLGLKAVDPLLPEHLAESLNVQVHVVDEVPGLDRETINVLLRDGADSWSAVTITDGSKNIVILNSGHSRARSASDLTHELAHIIIGHKPGRVDVTEDGALMLNTYERQQEDEANWLSGCLLLPRPALLWLSRQQPFDSRSAARHFGVSVDMLQYRLRVTGVANQRRMTVALSRQ